MLVLSIRESSPDVCPSSGQPWSSAKPRTTIQKVRRKGANIFGQKDFGWLGPPIWRVARSH